MMMSCHLMSSSSSAASCPIASTIPWISEASGKLERGKLSQTADSESEGSWYKKTTLQNQESTGQSVAGRGQEKFVTSEFQESQSNKERL